MKRKVQSGTLAVEAGKPAALTAPVKYGRYQLEVVSPDGGTASSVIFTAGWYADPGNLESPEMLEVALDKESYKPGETAKLRIVSKKGGKALVSVLGSGLHDMQTVDIPAGGGSVDLTVGDDWGPGAYATAILYTAMDETAKRMPSRAIGVKWIGVDQSARTLTVSLLPDEKVKSGATLTVPVKVEGLEPGEDARLTIAAVDTGILNLTRYATPAPEDHFYAQRMLGLEIRDYYGRLIDGMRAERGVLRSGGDGMSSLGLQGSPPVEETVSFYSGIVGVQADGTAQASFQLPDFNGSVKVMAVAWTKNKLGHAAKTVIVRDKLALTASLPRFVTLGDETRIDVAVHNVEGPDADGIVVVEVRLSAVGQPAPGEGEDDRRTIVIDLPATDRVRVVDLRWGRDEAVVIERTGVGG